MPPRENNFTEDIAVSNRSINLNNARSAQGGAQRPAQGQQGTGNPQRQMYDQAADAQRYSAAQGQVRRTQTPQRHNAYDQYTQQRSTQQRRAGYDDYAAQQAAAAQRRAQQPPYGTQRTSAVPPQRSAAADPAYAQRAAYAASVQRSAAGDAGTRTAGQAYSASRRPGQASRPAANGAHSGARGAQSRTAGQPVSGVARRRAAQKQKTRRRVIMGLSIALAVILVCGIALRIYLGTLINTGEVGKVTEAIKTPPQFSGSQINILAIGIDYTTSDADTTPRDPIGMTDMILYMRFDFQANTLKMLQIPRDLYVGADLPTGGTGKINALYKCGDDQDNRINNLATVVSNQLQLPIDNYVSIDMESLRQIVDLFGGIEVYVAQTLDYGGSHLDQGWQNLKGPSVEFFLRDRHNFATGDIGRLDNQRYFYSALFRRVRTATWQDIVKLMPVVQKYVNTDISITDCMGLAIKFLKIPSSNIMMCRLPTFDGAELYNGSSVQVADVDGTAALLNENFRTADTQVDAASYTLADWAHGDTPHEANVQWMNDVDAQGGGTVGTAADATTTGDDLIAQSQAQAASAAGTATSPAA